MNNYVKSVMAFRESKKTNIAILRPVACSEEALYRDIADACGGEGTVEIVNEGFLNSFEVMGKGLVDILIVPELELLEKHLSYPIKKYIDAGGAVIIACNDYFMTENGLNKRIGEEAEDAFYRETSAYLGIKPYASDITPESAYADPCWIQGAERSEGALPRAGVQMNVSSDRVAPRPIYGNAFIERYEVLRNYDAVIGCDKYGNKVNSQLTFAQNWETGARYAIYSSNQENSLIRKAHPLFERTLKAAVRFCKNKVFAVACEPNFACYRQGESVTVSYTAENGGKEKQTVDVTLRILNDKGSCVHQKKRTVCLKGASSITEKECWRPEEFGCDSYSVAVELHREGVLLSKAENGFVVWNEEVISQGPTISVNGKYFYIDGKSSILTGTNYYESNIGEVMWIKPDIKKLEEDFKQMSADGINCVRIHYHHAKWFNDYLKACTGQVFDYYKAVREEYLPSERILRIFDAHIYLSQKYHIIYGGDLFTLRPEEMGDPKGWMQLQDYARFDDKLKAQKEFLELLIPRYTDVPGIAWDIFNEPGVGYGPLKEIFDTEFRSWAAKIKEYMRALGDSHIITVGSEPERYGDILDYYAEHTNFKYIREHKWQTTLPEVIQECWLDRPPTPQGEQEQLNDIRQALFDVLEMGFAGFLPWQWTNQQRLWCDWRTSTQEIWDDRLGTCVRNDGTLKPAGRFYRDLIWLLEGLDFISYQNSTVTTGMGTLLMDRDGWEKLRIRLNDGGRIIREWASNRIVGQTMAVISDREADLFYISYPDADYFKANKACVLSVILQKAPAQLMVCTKPCGAEIASREAPDSNRFELTVQESDINYWFKIVYKA